MKPGTRAQVILEVVLELVTEVQEIIILDAVEKLFLVVEEVLHIVTIWQIFIN